jgi:hypothetical protein
MKIEELTIKDTSGFELAVQMLYELFRGGS